MGKQRVIAETGAGQHGVATATVAARAGLECVIYMGAVDMDFDYEEHFEARVATGYERLLYDCMIGDATLFQRADMIEAAWAVVTPVLDVWNAIPARDFPDYPAGSWGPSDADELLKRDGRAWKNYLD